MAWNDIFPVFGDDLLEEFRRDSTGEDHEKLEELFGVRKVISPKVGSNTLSLSLFWKSAEADSAGLPKPSRELMQNAYENGVVNRFHPWLHYVKPILNSPEHIRRAEERLGKHDFKLRVYMAHDLEFLIEDLEPYCEIYLMKSSSLNFAPGGLWRFLACDNENGISTIIDADLLGAPSFHIEAGLKMKEHDLGFWRYIGIEEAAEKPDHSFYTPIFGCGFGVDCKKSNFNWNELLRAFTWHSWKESLEGRARHPIHGDLPMFGTKWPYYGFDEWFLTSAAYPRVAATGVLTYVSIGRNASPCFPFDIEYVTWANRDSMLVHLPIGTLKLRPREPEDSITASI
jgi:hypothetical protein